MTDAEFTELMGKHLNHAPEAVRFFRSWNDYCHAVDDAVDNYAMKNLPLPTEELLKLLAMAAMIYSSNFYQRYATQLYPLVLVITNAYADSVKWEHSPEQHRQRMSDALRTAGNEMLLLIIGLVAGWDALREVSPVLREYSWNCHHDEIDKPV